MTLEADSSALRRAVVVDAGHGPSSLEGWTCRVQTCLADLEGRDAAELVLVHSQALRDADEWNGFVDWVRADVADGPVILILRDVSGAQLAELFRAGLFDAVDEQATIAQWQEVLDRAERELEDRTAGQAIQADTALTHQLLRDSRRRVRHETAEETQALLQAQADLERANQKLADHMAQVSLLYQFGRELSLASNWDDTLRNILAHLAEFIGAAGGALVLRAAPGGPYAPRQTYRWQEKSWDKVLLRITRQIDAGVASSLLAPGVFQVGRESEGAGRITALPLEHQGVRLGMLLLLFGDAAERERKAEAHLPFLQMVQVVLSEEVASAQMLDRLRDIGAFNTRVLETVSSAIWVCEGSGRSIFVNRAARGMLGLDLGPLRDDPDELPAVGRGRMLDRPLTGGAELDDLPEIFLDGKLSLDEEQAPPLAGLLARTRPYVGEGHVNDLFGESIPVKVQATPMAGRGGDDIWLLVILEDRRAARRADQARRRAEQAEALVAMSATLAHEIRNPLMGLSAQAELLADSLPVDDGRRDRIDLITGEVERINRTITDMLQFVRPCRPRRDDADPVRLMADCLELVRHRAGERAVTLDLDAQLGQTASVDADHLKQVMLNLLLNAVDAAPHGGTVRVNVTWPAALDLTDSQRGTTRSAPGLVIAVEDDGPGFGDVDSERLFEPFFTTKNTGTGLGLAYSRKVVDAHGGEIRARRDGAITRMEILLPRQAEAGKQLAGEAS